MMIAEYEFDMPEKYVAEDHPTPSPRRPTLGELLEREQVNITAAGGWTVPIDTTYDLFDQNTLRQARAEMIEDLEPIRAVRGGIQYGTIDLAEATLVREDDNVEAEPEDQAGVNLPEIRALINDFQRERYEPVYVFLGDSTVREVGKVNTAHGTQGLARLLRQVADRLEP